MRFILLLLVSSVVCSHSAWTQTFELGFNQNLRGYDFSRGLYRNPQQVFSSSGSIAVPEDQREKALFAPHSEFSARYRKGWFMTSVNVSYVHLRQDVVHWESTGYYDYGPQGEVAGKMNFYESDLRVVSAIFGVGLELGGVFDTQFERYRHALLLNVSWDNPVSLRIAHGTQDVRYENGGNTTGTATFNYGDDGFLEPQLYTGSRLIAGLRTLHYFQLTDQVSLNFNMTIYPSRIPEFYRHFDLDVGVGVTYMLGGTKE